MRNQKLEINKYLFWYYSNRHQEWLVHGNLYGYDTELEALKDNLGRKNVKDDGTIIDESGWQDFDWKIVKVV